MVVLSVFSFVVCVFFLHSYVVSVIGVMADVPAH